MDAVRSEEVRSAVREQYRQVAERAPCTCGPSCCATKSPELVVHCILKARAGC